MFKKFLVPPDVFFRHAIISRAVGGSQQILDVGGSLGELRKFLPNVSITTADVMEGGDILFNGKKLPLDTGSYETVISVDTLEHIPQKERLSFVKELCRVAKKSIVLLAPYGSSEHTLAEKQLAEAYRRSGKEIPHYLQEHIKYGLPGDSFLRSLEKEFGAVIGLSGRLWFDRINFSIHAFEVRNGKLNRLLYNGKYLWNFCANSIIVPWISIVAPAQSSTSRFLARIDKE